MKNPNTDHLTWLKGVLMEHGEEAPAYRILLTPSLAKQFLEHMRTNRPFRAHRVLQYRHKIRTNEWGYTGQPIIFNSDGQMMDGQHRCLAVIAENAEIEVLVVLGIDDEAFRFLDQGAARSGGDFLDGVPHRAAVSAALSWVWAEEKGVLGVGVGAHGHRNRMLPSDAPVVAKRHGRLIALSRRANQLRYLLHPGMAILSPAARGRDGLVRG